jgi:NAD(P)-dependent dehydrogenase (short-subunit alcohol dehydrogenase family)
MNSGPGRKGENPMPKTVLITGTSSGIGLETALYFHARGWQVIAAMRNPAQRQTALHQVPGIDLQHLDVTEISSIQQLVQHVTTSYGSLDVLVNNAGYALCGIFETASREEVGRQYATNVFGLMDLTREILPLFRKQKYGTLINIASMGGRVSFPLYSLYNSTKWAVEGFTEALQYELRPLNLRVKLIEPGVIHTHFYDSSMKMPDQSKITEYRTFAEPFMRNMLRFGERGIKPRAVAKTIFRAANAQSHKLRYIVGMDARLLLLFRRFLPDRMFFSLLRLIIH